LHRREAHWHASRRRCQQLGAERVEERQTVLVRRHVDALGRSAQVSSEDPEQRGASIPSSWKPTRQEGWRARSDQRGQRLDVSVVEHGQ
jgi:hypothetical protein